MFNNIWRHIMVKSSLLLLFVFTAVIHSQNLLDNSFGTEGIVKTNISSNFGAQLADVINNLYLYPDGKILAAGHTDRKFGLARYNSDGTLDNTFNPNGVGFIPPGTVKTALSNNFYNEIYSVSVHSDGRIIACGYVEDHNDNQNKWIALVRYTSDGQLDATFGTNGIVKIKVPVSNSWGHHSIPRKIFIGSDKYTIAGYVENFTTGTKSDFFIAKLNFDGTIDNTFGLNGFITIDLESNGFDRAYAAVQQPDGKIIIVGSWSATETSFKFNTVVRFNTDGTLDTDFGNGGIVRHQFGGSFPIKHEEAKAVVIQNDGKVVVAGDVTKESGEKDFYIIRYNSDGSLDNGFGSKGFTFIDFIGLHDEVYSMALQSDGKFVLAGASGDSSNRWDMAFARVNADGTLEKRFNLDLGSNIDVAYTVLIQPDGKILAGGFTVPAIFADFALIRLNPDLPVSVDKQTDNTPTNYSLYQNYPNPFNPSTTISFTLPKSSYVTLKVYDVLGREVAELVNDNLQAGSHSINFDASRLSSGTYFYRLQAGDVVQIKKMMLIK